MDLAVLKFIAMGLAIGLGVIGPGIGLGLATQAIIESISRQPEAEGQVSEYEAKDAKKHTAESKVRRIGE